MKRPIGNEDRTKNHGQDLFSHRTQTLRMRARQHIDEGSVTAGYSAELAIVLELLNDSLATELVCVLRYRRHHFMARGIHAQSVAREFLDHFERRAGRC
jgi:bacterioferritin